MSESLTGESTGVPASNEPTDNTPIETTAESSSQETISGEQSQETVSDDNTAPQQTQTEENGGEVEADDSLAKFAKSQGIEDLDDLSDREKRLLKIARDNQKAARSNSGQKVNDAVKDLVGTDAEARLARLEYKEVTDQFWSEPTRNRELETTMVEILNEKKEKLGKDFAFQLSQDLDTLYGLAQLKSGTFDPEAAKEEGRQEARNSIRKKQVASAPQAHAVTQSNSTPEITAEWIQNEYDPSNPEHVELVASLARSDLY